MQKIKAFTLAETIITVAIIAIIAALMIHWFDLNHVRQRELLGRFQLVYSKLDNLVSMTAATSKNHDSWSSDVNSLANLSCTDNNNKSECLKKAFMSTSKQLVDCPDPSKCFENYDGLTNQLKSIFPSFSVNNLTAFTISGGVNVLAAYLDDECELNIPVGKGRNNEIEKVKGCGFLLTDVNGKDKPNNLLVDDAATVDRFLMVITKNGLVKSNLLDELAGCPKGTEYKEATKSCETKYVCSVNMEYMKKVEQVNNANLLTKSYPDGSEHPDCYELKCASGDAFNSNKKCPEPCSAEDERHLGGLWVSEGGDLPDGTEKACCVPINNQADLAAINKDTTSRGRTYCLTRDITFDKAGAGSDETTGWTPISQFKGTFYGNGHKISGLYINNTTLTYAGLFGYVNGGTIRDLIMDDGNVAGKYCSGGAVGHINNKGILTNIINSGSVSSDSSAANHAFAGGALGYNDASTITNVINSGSLSAFANYDKYSAFAGGAIGYNYNSTSPITNVINSGSVSAFSKGCTSFAGGAIGSSYKSTSTITNVINSGSVSASTDSLKYSAAGGAIGLNNASTITNVINSGSVSTSFSSDNSHSSSYTGGAIGYNYASTITNVINSGSLSAYSRSSKSIAGGALGYNNTPNSATTITNVINSGSLLASVDSSYLNSSAAGGALGYNNTPNSATTITRVINTGNITNTNTEDTYVGGVVGRNYSGTISLLGSFYLSGTASGCKNDKDETGCSVKTDEELKLATNYSTYDTNVWSIVNGYYATIRASLMPPQIFRDCRNNKTPYGGCYDVLNTPNALMPDFGADFNINNITEAQKPYIMWAWKKPATNTSTIELPVLRFQCKPYRTDGFDCCRPSYATWEPKLEACPALVVPDGANYRETND